MKKLLLLSTLVLLSFINSFSQEFEVHDNGLIYNEETMSQLKYIVDSLNLKFYTCDLGKTYLSKSQAMGHYIEMEDGQTWSAWQDIKDGISFDEFVNKFPEAKIVKDIPVVRFKYKKYDGSTVVKFNNVSLSYGDDYTFHYYSDTTIYDELLKGQWLLREADRNELKSKNLYMFFFPNGFSSSNLPDEYQTMVGYSECMVDTSTSIFYDDAEYGRPGFDKPLKKMNMSEMKEALEKKRHTKVMGQCSMDDSPRIHAQNIAYLAAHTISWEIFLRAHLDIMNDRFDRVSDGSWAWAGRKTYIKELEELDINVKDLLLGIALRVENPSSRHYYGNVYRIGRALSETEQQEEIEKLMFTMIMDKKLDLYNRSMIYALFLEYNYFVGEKDKDRAKENVKKLKEAVKTFPEFLATTAEFEN